MAASYLIDTSVVIKYLNAALNGLGVKFIDNIIDEHCSISFISEIELLAWNPPNNEDLAIYKLFVNQAKTIGLDQNIIDETIRIRRLRRLKLPDALIAATAVTRDLTLIADNDKDFLKVPDLKYLNPTKL